MFVMELNPYSARTNGQEIVETSIHRLDFVNEKLVSKKSVENL